MPRERLGRAHIARLHRSAAGREPSIRGKWEGVAMVSRCLRGVIVVEAILLLIAIAALPRGALTFATALTACAALVILDFCVVAALYWALRLYAATAPSEGAGRGAHTWRCALTERWRCSRPSWSFNLSNVGGWAPRRWENLPLGASLFCWFTVISAIAAYGGGCGDAFARGDTLWRRSTSNLRSPTSIDLPNDWANASTRCSPRPAPRRSCSSPTAWAAWRLAPTFAGTARPA